MYTLSPPQERIRITQRFIVKLAALTLTVAAFTGQSLTMNAFETGKVLKGYIQENTMQKEQSTDALFLLKEKRNRELEKKYGKNRVRNITDGVDYIRVVRRINSKPVKINIAEIDRGINPDIEILPQSASPDKIHTKAKVNNIAVKSNALIAVNGTYFKPDTGTPLGVLVINNEIISGPVYNRAAFMIYKDKFETARISFKGKIKSGNKESDIDGINRPRMSKNQVVIYTSKWGFRSPLSKIPQKNIAVKNNKIVAVSDSALMIPEGGYVLSGPYEKLARFNTGDEVNIKYSLEPSKSTQAENIISGGPYLMKDGRIFTDTASENLNSIQGKNPRTAIGYTKDNVMIIVTVDGRTEGSSGMTLNELAAFMKSLGCYEAINLDGGSSTAMYENGVLHSGTGLKGAVAVSNALVVREKV